MTGAGRVLIADADPGASKVLAAILADEGFGVQTAACAASALQILETEEIDTIISDLHLPGSDGLALIREGTGRQPEIPVIVLSAGAASDVSAWVIDRGAWGYFRKPPDYPLLKGMVARAVNSRCLGRQLQAAQQQLRWQELRQQTGTDMGAWTAWGQALELGREAAGNLLIQAEAGTGRRRLAQALHQWRTQGKHPFYPFDCASGELIFKERRADGSVFPALHPSLRTGTVYLREPASLHLIGQHRLQKMLDDLPVGGVRIIAATGIDLAREAAAGRFSSTLLDRLAEQTILVPPLRSRRQEIAWLAWRFLCQAVGSISPPLFAAEALQAMIDHAWPGNDRQLEGAVIQAAATAAGGEIGREHLPWEIIGSPLPGPSTLREMETLIIREALHKSGGNKSHAAKMLGVSRKTLYKRLKEIRTGDSSACVAG